jgi:hypothetical protein
VLGTSLALAGCGASESSDGGGTAAATVAGRTFQVANVRLTLETEDEPYFTIAGDDAAGPQADCLPGLGGGLSLYGDLPGGVKTVADLAGRELPFEFSGDGDDFNLCFVGTDGLLGVESGTVRFGTVDGTNVSFSFDGTFVLYDGAGSEKPGIAASGGGVAHLETR